MEDDPHWGGGIPSEISPLLLLLLSLLLKSWLLLF